MQHGDTVMTIQRQICEQTGIRPDQQRLVDCGRVLRPTEMLTDHSSITLFVKSIKVRQLFRFKRFLFKPIILHQINVFSPVQLIKQSKRKNPLEVRSQKGAGSYRDVLRAAVRGIQIVPNSGEVGFFEVIGHFSPGMQAIGLAVHGSHCTWDLSGNFYSSIPGLKSFESTSIRCRGAERIGIVVDCMTRPVVRFYIDNKRVYDLCMTKELFGQFIYPLCCPLACDYEICEIAPIPRGCGGDIDVLARRQPPSLPLWAVQSCARDQRQAIPSSISRVGGGVGSGGSKVRCGGGGGGSKDLSWAFYSLPVVDTSGEERGRMFINPENTVQDGQEQFAEWTGVPVSDQRMFLGDMQLEGSMLWGNFSGLRNGTEVRIIVVLPKVFLCLAQY